MLGLAGDLVLLVEDRLALTVFEMEGGVDLAPALDSLLIEVVGAALGAVEGPTEMVADVKEKVDGAAGVGRCGDAFAVAVGFKVDDSRAGGKDSPVHGVGEGLLLGECETGARGRKRAGLLARSRCHERKGAR
jgi:hypothetical protein